MRKRHPVLASQQSVQAARRGIAQGLLAAAMHELHPPADPTGNRSCEVAHRVGNIVLSTQGSRLKIHGLKHGQRGAAAHVEAERIAAQGVVVGLVKYIQKAPFRIGAGAGLERSEQADEAQAQ